jgi:hypothetical protein
MRHLTALLDPGYDEEGFQPIARRMRLFGGGGKSPPAPPPPPAPEKPPQLAKMPTMAAARAKATASALGPGGAPSSTFQAGPSGIDDNDLLLGKNKLLGQ